MINLLSSFYGETVLSLLGYIFAFALVFAVFYIRRKYPNLTKIIDCINCIILTLFALFGVNILVTSKPDLVLVIVFIFLVLMPCVSVFILSLKHLIYVIKTLIGKQEMKVIILIFSLLAIICLIVCVVNVFYVFNVILN